VSKLGHGNQKEIDALKSSYTMQNEKYQNFLKEKLIFQTERDHIISEIKSLEIKIEHHQGKVLDEITKHKSEFNFKLEDFDSMFRKVQIDNQTTRNLVKKQYDEFAHMYSHIEINKAAI
jgi:phenylalanyl-tRNA synthetase alpha subunit